jgi:uncharacterized protein (DUF2147 family)
MATQVLARRHDVDWLRVGATYLLFLFHGAMAFNPAPFYHIRNGDLSFAMLVLCGFVSLWHMPLFFLLAGWSMPSSLRARGGRGFVRERLLRLGVPLLAGCVLFGPLIKYVELSSGLDLSHTGLRVSPALQESFREIIPSGLDVAPAFTERFIEFWPTYFTSLGRFTWAHLWFIAYLLAFSLLYRPLFSSLLARSGRLLAARVAWIYAPIAPLVAIQLVLRPHWPGIQNLYDDWANVAYYSVYLLSGFVLATHPRLETLLHGEWKRAGILGIGTALVLLLVAVGVLQSTAVALAGSAIAGWCFVVAILGLGNRLLSFTNAALDYLRPSALPVYVLHQVAIVGVGHWLVLDLPLGIGPKFGLLVAGSLAATLAVYHLVVRRSAVVAFLLGEKSAAHGLPQLAVSAAVAVLVTIAVSRGAPATAAPMPVGRWWAEGGAAHVEIRPCGPNLCGQVVWLRSPFDEFGCELRDRRNPDEALRDRPVLGLEILHGLTPAAGGEWWAGGTIYDPGSGRTYACQLRLDGEHRLELRGYVGFPLLGRTTTWLRVGAEEQLCRQLTDG